MTKEGIEESRQWLMRFVRLNGSELNETELNVADGFIDRLCAAASEPESLVGKGVRVIGGEPTPPALTSDPQFVC